MKLNLKKNGELLGLIVGIISSIIYILNTVFKIQLINNNQLVMGFEVLNLLVLLIALLSIKDYELSVTHKEVMKLKELLSINNNDDINTILQRVNGLVKQLMYCVRWFAIILGIFYLLQLFIDFTHLSYDSTIDKMPDNIGKGLWDLFQSVGNKFIGNAKYLSVEVLTNVTNLFSAAFLFLAFQVLFSVTLEPDNKTWRLKSYKPNSIAILIITANILFIINGIPGVALSDVDVVIGLACGIYNGVAMLLLFSRFISMEYFFQHSSAQWQRTFYLYGTVIVLPLYVVAQPLYGLLDKDTLFKSIVFLICFWGKLVFLLFIFTMLKKRWMQSYLFMAISQKDTLRKISDDIGGVENL